MKINWSSALADYLKNQAVSYASIAVKYGVSLQAVKKRAGKEGWVNLRQKSIQKVNQELPEKIREKIAEANARQAQIGKWLQWQGIKAIANKHLEPGNFTQAKDSIKEGVRIEREVLTLLNGLSSQINQEQINTIELDEMCQEATKVLKGLDYSNKVKVVRDIIDRVIVKERSGVEVCGHIPLFAQKLGYEPTSRDCGPS